MVKYSRLPKKKENEKVESWGRHHVFVCTNKSCSLLHYHLHFYINFTILPVCEWVHKCLHTCVGIFAPSNFFLSEQLKADLMKEVAYTRRKLHQASLQYYCALNALQYRKRIAMLEPMLGYTHAQVLSSSWSVTS